MPEDSAFFPTPDAFGRVSGLHQRSDCLQGEGVTRLCLFHLLSFGLLFLQLHPTSTALCVERGDERNRGRVNPTLFNLDWGSVELIPRDLLLG